MLSPLSGGVTGGIPRFSICFLGQIKENDRWSCRVTFVNGKTAEAAFSLPAIIAIWDNVHVKEFTLNQSEKEAYHQLLTMSK